MSRRGYILTELLVVMGMTSVVFSVAVGMIHRVMHEQKFTDRDNAMHRVAERLSTRLREDIHGADRAELVASGEEGEPRLVLYQPGERIVTYAVRDHVLERTSVPESGPTHHDSFRFPDNYRLQFFDVPGERVALTAFAIPQAYVATASGKSREPVFENEVRRAVMHVEASVGRDHRFLNETRTPGES